MKKCVVSLQCKKKPKCLFKYTKPKCFLVNVSRIENQIGLEFFKVRGSEAIAAMAELQNPIVLSRIPRLFRVAGQRVPLIGRLAVLCRPFRQIVRQAATIAHGTAMGFWPMERNGSARRDSSSRANGIGCAADEKIKAASRDVAFIISLHL
ncbi:MAG: hypothetical protein K6E73_06715 [Bacteroidales bacterium]|nr:hypothetical protein [Bacteroidales bacterium]